MTELSVVLPVRNEAGNAGPLLEEILSALDGHAAFEVIFVDDGSTDGTAAEILATRAGRTNVRLLRHRISCGQSAAVRTGILAATAPLIATLDGDGQNPPHEIPRLLAAYEAAAARDPAVGLVIGHRARRSDTAFRRLSSRAAYRFRMLALGDPTRDSGCGLRVFPKELYLALPFFDHMHRFMSALVRREGRTVLEIDVDHRPRGAGRSNYGFFDRLWVGIADLRGVMWLNRRRRLPQVSSED